MDMEAKTTRRSVFRWSLGLALVLAGWALDDHAQAQMKISKSQVNYRTHPNGDHYCGNCRFFMPQKNECRLVEGHIVANGWCERWVPRKP